MLVEKAVPMDWIEQIRTVTDEMVERSRHQKTSDAVFDLEPGHTAEGRGCVACRARSNSIRSTGNSCVKSPIGDIAADLVGPDVKFHHQKLNFKWAEGGEEVKWHQDIQFWPHTNYNPADDRHLSPRLRRRPGSAGGAARQPRRTSLHQYNDHGEWVGCLSDRDVAKLTSIRPSI